MRLLLTVLFVLRMVMPSPQEYATSELEIVLFVPVISTPLAPGQLVGAV